MPLNKMEWEKEKIAIFLMWFSPYLLHPLFHPPFWLKPFPLLFISLVDFHPPTFSTDLHISVYMTNISNILIFIPLVLFVLFVYLHQNVMNFCLSTK